MKLKVLSVVGTRPEAIKMAPIIRELEGRRGEIDSRVCATAQHRHMLDQVLRLFEITPDYDLDIMQDEQSPIRVAAGVLGGLESILEAERPHWVLVQGDTTTVAAGALAAFYAGAKVGHVEAGLRTYDRYRPFPEEVNRRIAGVIADAHFAPTERAREHLLKEGVSASAVYVTGNPVVDALHMVSALPYNPAEGPLRDIPWDKPIVVVTAHRRENFGEPLEQICLALKDLAATYRAALHIVYPVHRNPNVREPVSRILGGVAGITLTQPLDYLPFTYLIKRARLILTDSGGIQEEGPGLGKPVLVLRDVTERPEAVEAGTARLVGTDRGKVFEWTRRLLEDRDEYERMARAVNPFGDGKASRRIVEALVRLGTGAGPRVQSNPSARTGEGRCC
jgi:UDP-N-acetylglucosamine 2-epimerase (non-hydrolysing)